MRFDELQAQDCYSSQWFEHFEDKCSLIFRLHFAIEISDEEEDEPVKHLQSLHGPCLRIFDERHELTDNVREPLALIHQLIIPVEDMLDGNADVLLDGVLVQVPAGC